MLVELCMAKIELCMVAVLRSPLQPRSAPLAWPQDVTERARAPRARASGLAPGVSGARPRVSFERACEPLKSGEMSPADWSGSLRRGLGPPKPIKVEPPSRALSDLAQHLGVEESPRYKRMATPSKRRMPEKKLQGVPKMQPHASPFPKRKASPQMQPSNFHHFTDRDFWEFEAHPSAEPSGVPYVEPCHQKLPVFMGFFWRDSFEWLDGKLGASTRGGKCEGSKKCQSSRGWGLGISFWTFGHWGSLGSVWQPPRHGLQLARALSARELDGWRVGRSCSRFHREKTREECHGSEAFRAIWAFGVYDPFPWVSGRWFLCSFLWSFIALVQSVSNFLLSPDVVGNKGFWQIICHDVIMLNGENSQGWSPFWADGRWKLSCNSQTLLVGGMSVNWMSSWRPTRGQGCNSS